MRAKFQRVLLAALLLTNSLANAAAPARSNDVERQIITELNLEVFVHLRNAQTYLHGLINCFQEVPQIQDGQAGAMYTEFTTCSEIRGKLLADLPGAFNRMRVNLALSEPKMRDEPLSVELNPSQITRMNVNPVHHFDGLPKMAPLNEAEIKDANLLWDQATLNAQERYEQNSYLSQMLARNSQLTEAQITSYEEYDDKKRVRFVALSRNKARAVWLKAYHNEISTMPLVAFLTKPLKLDNGPEDRAQIREGLYQLLTNNCMVRTVKYHKTADSRRAATVVCESLTRSLMANARQPLSSQQRFIDRYESDLDHKKPLADLDKGWMNQNRHQLLMVFKMHPLMVEQFRKRQTASPERLAALNALKTEFDGLDLQATIGEVGLYLGLGFVCTFGLRRIPFATKFIQKLGMPICLFATGLPVNTVQWFVGDREYWSRFSETFSGAPYREMMQDLDTLSSAEFAQTLNSVFMVVGTGLPEVFRATKPLVVAWKLKRSR